MVIHENLRFVSFSFPGKTLKKWNDSTRIISHIENEDSSRGLKNCVESSKNLLNRTQMRT